MPIYEFYCRACHRVYSFLSRSINTKASPSCPRCGAAGLARQASTFAVSRGLKESAEGDEGGPEIDDARLERAMESLAGDIDGVDENDPKQAARLMRKLFDAGGLPVGGGMEEALRRMEAGEDPDRIEEQLGDDLDGDPFGAPGKRLRNRLRRLAPPTHDPHLYEL